MYLRSAAIDCDPAQCGVTAKALDDVWKTHTHTHTAHTVPFEVLEWSRLAHSLIYCVD